MAHQRSQRTLVAFQYCLLVLSGVDSAAAIYLILGPGNEVTIAGASPMLTAVSTIFALYKLLNAELLSTRRLSPSHICYYTRSFPGDTSRATCFLTLTRRTSCALRV